MGRSDEKNFILSPFLPNSILSYLEFKGMECYL